MHARTPLGRPAVWLMVCCVLCATPSAVAWPQDFELVETNAVPGPAHPGIDYEFAHVSAFNAEAAGVTVADFDADGDDDLFFGATEGHANQLYVNDGAGRFTESAAAYGVAEPERRRAAGLFIDVDNDGDLDLLTCGYPGFGGPLDLDLLTLFRNQGPPDHTFVDATREVGGFALDPDTEATIIGVLGGVAAADYDNNGLLDILVTYWFRDAPNNDYLDDQFRLFKNVRAADGGHAFVDATAEAGLDGVGQGAVWQPSFVDIDRDGDMDLHLNIEYGPDELRLNQGDGTFGPNIATAVGMNFNVGDWGHEMGAGFADFDNDLDIDFVLTNAGNGFPDKADAFYRNDSDLSAGGSGPAFLEIGQDNFVSAWSTGVGWGASFGDLDNDGDKDLVTARGLGAMGAVNRVLENRFPALTPDLGGGIPTLDWNDVSLFQTDYSCFGGQLDISRGLALFDADNDGDLDVATTRSTSTVVADPDANVKAGFFVNELSGARAWLGIDLREAGGSLNTVGARVYVRGGGPGGVTQLREVVAGSSFLSQEGYRQHFGLGDAAADWILVRWFDGSQQVYKPADVELIGNLSLRRAALDQTGDLDGNGLVDCHDLQLFLAGHLQPGMVDAAVPDWPWRLLADVNGNGELEPDDFAALRAQVPDVWCRLNGPVLGPGLDAGAGGTVVPGGGAALDR